MHYVDRMAAEQYYMINTTESTVSFGVETTQVLDPNANLGRLSLRLTSIESWTHGLFILDLAHMPDAVCGTWPSFWSLGGTGTWPTSGSFEVIGDNSILHRRPPSRTVPRQTLLLRGRGGLQMQPCAYVLVSKHRLVSETDRASIGPFGAYPGC